jgi:O-acetyl-ADP-ribose deacetylase (regulator of RNase III)
MTNKGIELLKGDITRLEVDAIVNAANKSLLGGGGVDRAIHKAAGPDLYRECESLNGCITGQAKITKGYRLKARFIIHTVGPVWSGGLKDETEQLASCYQSSLALANEHKLKSIAFPGISTGLYGFPKELAATIAVTETRRFMSKSLYPEKVIFIAYDDESYEIYLKLLKK